MIAQRPSFELGFLPESNIVCFRLKSSSKANPNSLIRQRLLQDGRFYIVQTILHNQLYLRVSLMNPLTTTQDLQELLDLIEKI
jgi:L-2,4-diaminobutyrate decarboxylase